jgi:hypothetical protein
MESGAEVEEMNDPAGELGLVSKGMGILSTTWA